MREDITSEIGTRKDNRLQATKMLLTIDSNNTKEIEKKLIEKYGGGISYCCIGTSESSTTVYLHLKERLRFAKDRNPFLELLFPYQVDIQIIKPSKEEQRQSFDIVRKMRYCNEFGKKDSNILDMQIEKSSSLVADRRESVVIPSLTISKNSKMISGYCFLVTILAIGELKKERIQSKILQKYPSEINYLCVSKEVYRNSLQINELKEMYKIDEKLDILEEKACHILIAFNRQKRMYITKGGQNPMGSIFNKISYIKAIRISDKNIKKSILFVKKNQDYLETGEANIEVNDSEYITEDNVENYVMNRIKRGSSYEEILEHDMEIVENYMLKNSDWLKRMINDVAMKNNKHVSKEVLYEELALILSIQNSEDGKQKNQMRDLIYKLINVLKHEKNDQQEDRLLLEQPK
jgi:hypothetical protein